MSKDPSQADADIGPYLYNWPVSAHLSGLVQSITGYAEGGIPLQASVQPVTLAVPFIITFTDGFRIGLGRGAAASEKRTSFTAGIFSSPVEISSDGKSECHQMVSLDDLDPAFHRLRNRLAQSPGWHERLAMVEAFVSLRLRHSPQVHRGVERALNMIVADSGNVRIGQVAADTDLSIKHLAHLFRDHIGVGAKTVARIVRFNTALHEASADLTPDWAHIAAGCGYADQAHLSREFLSFSGYSPGEWAALRGR